MAESATRFGFWVNAGFWACVLVATAGGISGCADMSTTGVTAQGNQHLTPSDEPEVRRRARIRLELAVNYLGLGRVDVALDEVKQSLVADPSYADAYNVLGLIYMQLKDLTQADQSFQRALALRPGDPDVLHNRAWLVCQLGRYAEAEAMFTTVLANPGYTARSKTLMAQGLCQARVGKMEMAEKNLLAAYEIDAGNPVIGYNIGVVQFQRGEYKRAQFYIRRLNNSELANAESLWLGIKIERALNDPVSTRQIADQLRRRFPDSREFSAFQRGAFDE
ncbi:MAG: type IV pilus biogenesis/stability protein PilW [Giesbergeria sp.]